MNSGRIALGFLIIAVIVASLFFGVAKMPAAYAATNSNGSTTANVVVNGFVSITLSNVPINFSSVDPGTSNNQASASLGWPLNIQVDGTTNAGVDVFMNASTFVSGSNNFGVGMMHYNVTNSTSGRVSNATCFAVSYPCNYTSVVTKTFNETARLGTPLTTAMYNWLTVPSGQSPGTYANVVQICAEQQGTTGC